MKRYILPLMLIAAPSWVAARQLSASEALSRAMDQTRSNMPAMSVRTFDASAPVYVSGNGQTNEYYVFNAPQRQGFVIVSADDCAAPVLGYSDHGAFDENNLPDNLHWWLSQYQQEISYAIANKIPYLRHNAQERREIPPFVSTKWGQDSPFNNMCPQIDGSPCVTGCVATAMAQIMNYHKCPVQATGSNEYCWGADTLSIDFADITFDWDNMLNVYETDSPEINCEAVAQLMYACGMSVNMAYGPTSSGASSSMIPNALINYFGYDKGTQLVNRNYYDSAEWEDIIYTELQDRRPVLYSGQTVNSEGHAFVCDGYLDGYFHINWGWTGVSDGYFLLSALSPDIQGTGGGSGAFNMDQRAVIGIQKERPGSQYPTSFAMSNDFGTSQSTYNIKEEVEFVADGEHNGFFNIGNEEVTVYYGVKAVSSTGAVSHYASGRALTVKPSIGYIRFWVDMSSIAAGTYTVTPAYRTSDGTWHDILVPNGYVKQLLLTATGSTLSFAPVKIDPDFKVEDFQLLTPLYEDCYFKALANMTAKSEYSTKVCVGIYDIGSDRPRAFGDDVYVTVKPGETFTLEYISWLSHYYGEMPSPGKYQLRLTDANRRPISEPVDVDYQETPSLTSISMDNLRIATGDTAPLDDISILGTMTCGNGFFANQCIIFLFPGNGGTSLTYFKTPIFFLSEGESTDFNIHVQYPEGIPGNKYMIRGYVLSNNNYVAISDRCTFTLTEPVPIIEVTSIVLDQTEAEMYVSTVLQLTATINSDATDQTITWTSNDPQVASVSDDGLVTAKSAGTTVITAKAGLLTADCTVTVFDPDGITDVDLGQVSVISSGRTLSVYGLNGQKIKVTNAYGVDVYQGYDSTVTVASPGVYVVTIGTKRVKAVVR